MRSARIVLKIPKNTKRIYVTRGVFSRLARNAATRWRIIWLAHRLRLNHGASEKELVALEFDYSVSPNKKQIADGWAAIQAQMIRRDAQPAKSVRFHRNYQPF